jgi:hypothetical protein
VYHFFVVLWCKVGIHQGGGSGLGGVYLVLGCFCWENGIHQPFVGFLKVPPKQRAPIWSTMSLWLPWGHFGVGGPR